MSKTAALTSLYEDFVEARSAFVRELTPHMERLKHFHQVEQDSIYVFHELVSKDYRIRGNCLQIEFEDYDSNRLDWFEIELKYLEMEEQEFLDALKERKSSLYRQKREELARINNASKAVRRLQYEQLRKEFENE